MPNLLQTGVRRGLRNLPVLVMVWLAATAWFPPAQAAELTRAQVESALAAGATPDLSGKDLSGLDLSGLDFKAARMRGVAPRMRAYCGPGGRPLALRSSPVVTGLTWR